MKEKILKASEQVRGCINLPGSKSETNRAIIIAALGRGKCKLNNILFSDDTLYMCNALKNIGINIEINENDSYVIVEGISGNFDNLTLGSLK